MKCPACAYDNADDALACNLCGAIIGKAKTQRHPSPSPLARDSAVAAKYVPVAPAPRASTRDDRPRHLLKPVGAPPIELEVGKLFTIGRAPESSLSIPSGRVSRNHAEIRWDGARAILADRGSSNGTFVGGKPVNEHELQSGEEIEVGPFFCTYVVERGSALAEKKREEDLNVTKTMSATEGLLAGKILPSSNGELLQTIELNQKTGTLDVFGPAGHGWFAVLQGVPLGAEFGGLRDVDAVFAILALTSGRFTFLPTVSCNERRINTSMTGLLLEYERRRDEAQVGETEEGEG